MDQWSAQRHAFIVKRLFEMATLLLKGREYFASIISSQLYAEI
jgi:hypothetical protein